jgi:hypothetical protein
LGIEDILDNASGQITVWLHGNQLTGARFVSWHREDGTLVCRGGNGFTDEDVHYIRASGIQGVTVRVAAARSESDRLGAGVRESLREAAGYPVSLAIRPDAFANAPSALNAWLQNIIAAVRLLEPLREALQSQVDQILLREGSAIAVLGGSTLILEATPEAVPSTEVLRTSIEPLLE